MTDTTLDDETEVPLAEALETLTPNPRVTGYPPGNPKNVSDQEQELRKEEEAKFGKPVAATRAWARATEARNKRGGNPKPSSGAKPGAANPKAGTASNFDASPMAGAIKSNAKGKTKADLEKWSRSVQFAHSLLAMKMQDGNWAISDDESLLLTEAVVDLLEHYNIKLKGQAGAWGALVYAVGMIYGPRVASLIMSKRAQAHQPNNAQAS